MDPGSNEQKKHGYISLFASFAEEGKGLLNRLIDIQLVQVDWLSGNGVRRNHHPRQSVEVGLAVRDYRGFRPRVVSVHDVAITVAVIKSFRVRGLTVARAQLDMR